MEYFFSIIVVAMILFGAILYEKVKKSKGSIIINRNEPECIIEGTLSGTVDLSLHRSTRVYSCYISLICEHVTTYETKNGQREQRKTIFEDRETVMKEKNLLRGYNNSFPFSFTVPTPSDYEKSEDIENQSILKKLGTQLRQADRYFEWSLKAVADVKGINLSSQEPLHPIYKHHSQYQEVELENIREQQSK